jgi:hypothetical protein
MALGRGIFGQARPTEKATPTRPSNFRESTEERTKEPLLEYPDSATGNDTPADYGYSEYTDRPVGVYVTTPIPADRRLVEWSAGTLQLNSATPTCIASDERRRVRFLVRNLDDADDVILTRKQTDQPFTGLLLPAGQEILMEHTCSVWAIAEANTPSITYLSELVVDERHD